MLLGFMLAVAGIGLLVRRRWGRTMSIVIAALQIVSTIVAVVLTIQHFSALPDQPELRTRSHELTAQAGSIVGMIVASIYPVILLIILTRRSLRHWPSSHSTASSSMS